MTDMWKCPECGREFTKVSKEHFCKELNDVDDYINMQPEEIRPLLCDIRRTIRRAAPEAEEKISWRMPTFRQGENIIHFAAFKKHIGIYPGDEAVAAFAERLTEYKTSKGAVQLPLDKPLDLKLIEDIVLWRLSRIKQKKIQKSL